MIDIVPGQLWVWKPNIPQMEHIKTFWPMTIVMDKSRGEFTFGEHVNALTNDLFTIVSNDDDGPFEPDLHTVDLTRNDPTLEIRTRSRYCVVLLRGQLVWMKHNDLVDHAQLLS
jgi:hypothetical protein